MFLTTSILVNSSTIPFSESSSDVFILYIAYFVVMFGSVQTVCCHQKRSSYSSTKWAKRSIVGCTSSGMPSPQEGVSNAMPSKGVNIS